MSLLTRDQILKNRSVFIHQIELQQSELLNDSKVTSSETTLAKFSKDIKIFARVRPMLLPELSTPNFAVIKNNSSKIVVFEPGFSLTVLMFLLKFIMKFKRKGQPKVKLNEFTYDAAFGESASNEDVYDDLLSSLVNLAVDGGVSSLIACGQVFCLFE
jgi:hypothetical protein